MSTMNITYDAWCAGSKLSRPEHLSLMLQTCYKLELENAELDEKLESKRKTIKSLNEELEKLRIISIENERLAIENKHLREDRPQSELDAAHLAAENVMLNTTFANYISATHSIEKENERLASTVRGLEMELDRLERERTQWLCTCGGNKQNK